jgi:hypothetical protein
MLRMKKHLLIYSLTLILLMAFPFVMNAVPVAPGIEQVMDDDVNMTVNG